MIEFTRGDTFAFKVLISLKNETPITSSDIQSLFITCKKEPTKESEEIFKKTIDNVNIDENGYCHIVFEPKDTENLPYGTYYFDIEITLNSGYRKTKVYKFNLTEETTTHGGEENGI